MSYDGWRKESEISTFRMKSLSLSEDKLRYKQYGNLSAEIPITAITKIKVVNRSSFRHPFLGCILGLTGLIASLFLAVYTIISVGFMHVFILPKGPLAPFIFTLSVYLLWNLKKSPVIPWCIVHTNKKKFVILVHDGSMNEVKGLVDKINELRKSWRYSPV